MLRLADNSHPPFGASVTNAKGRELGMVADSGLAWLSGVNPGETLNVGWDGRTQCVVDIRQNWTRHSNCCCPAVRRTDGTRG